MTTKSALLAVLALSTVLSIHAQGFGGCVDSPENPTLLLAGLAAGGFAVSHLRMRYRTRRGPRKSLK